MANGVRDRLLGQAVDRSRDRRLEVGRVAGDLHVDGWAGAELDALIVDESSMIDVQLAQSLCAATLIGTLRGNSFWKGGRLPKQAIILCPDNLITLADAGFQPFPVEDGHIAANIANVTLVLQTFGGVSYSFAAHAEHVGN